MGKHRFPEGKALLCRMVCIDTKKKRTLLAESLLYSVCPAWVLANGCKSRMSPNSGNHTANGKGVHRELESERSRRQTSGLTDRNFI